jgi:hypothetical protein
MFKTVKDSERNMLVLLPAQAMEERIHGYLQQVHLNERRERLASQRDNLWHHIYRNREASHDERIAVCSSEAAPFLLLAFSRSKSR